MHFIKTLLLFIFPVFSLNSYAQQNPTYNAGIEAQIKKVEQNLGGWVQIQDSANTWTLQQRMAFYKIKGLSIAVVQNYKVVWARGYGWADEGAKKTVTPQTLFQAASISKSLNAIGVLKLVQDKKINLDADINDYLRTWKFPYDSVSKGKKITVAHLLSHSAGLTVHGFPGYANNDTIPSVPEILNGKAPANTVAVRSQFEPGIRFQYSGGGTTILQMMVMDITKQPYDEFMWQQVLKPMRMMMSSYAKLPSAQKKPFLSTGYRADGKEVETKYHVYPEQAAAGLWTNPTDLCKYVIETQLALEGKSGKVLNTEMTKLRLTPYIDSSVALGVFIERKGDEKYFGHNGQNEGFLSTSTGSFKNGNGVVVMVNGDHGRLLNEVVYSVATVYGWKDYYTPKIKKIVPVADSLLDAYTGNYILERDSITIIRKGNRMILTVNNSESFQLFFSADQEFFTKEMPLEFTIDKEPSGIIKGFYFKEGSREMRARKL